MMSEIRKVVIFGEKRSSNNVGVIKGLWGTAKREKAREHIQFYI